MLNMWDVDAIAKQLRTALKGGWFRDSPNPHARPLAVDEGSVRFGPGQSMDFGAVFAEPQPSFEEGYAYHATPVDNLPAIQKDGLAPQNAPRFAGDTGRHVYLSTSPSAALLWGRRIAEEAYRKSYNSRDGGKAPRMALLRVPLGDVKDVDAPNAYRQDEVRSAAVGPDNVQRWRQGLWSAL